MRVCPQNTRADKMTYPTAASLWIGGSLSWLEQLCLSSFVSVGQPIKLYTYGTVRGVPEGVELADANSIWSPPQALAAAQAPALIADFFRLYMMRATDEIWVDADMVALRPFVANEHGFAAGLARDGGEINNAVLRLPPESATLTGMISAIENPDFVPLWMRRIHQKELRQLPHMERILRAHKMMRAVFGPRALTHIMNETGEAHRAAVPDVYYPVPWPYTDALFEPMDRVAEWTTEATQGIHLWKNLTRKYHVTHIPHPGSFLGKLVERHSIDVSNLKQVNYDAAHWR